jgi:arylsulfatase A-like enzyme
VTANRGRNALSEVIRAILWLAGAAAIGYYWSLAETVLIRRTFRSGIYFSKDFFSALNGRFVFYGLAAVIFTLLSALIFYGWRRAKRGRAPAISVRAGALAATTSLALWANLSFLSLYLIYEKIELPAWNEAAYAAGFLVPAVITAATLAAAARLYAKYRTVRRTVSYAAYVLLAVAALAALSSAVRAWRGSSSRPIPRDLPDVVLITLDAWRADTFSPELTPTLSDYARANGVVFTNARAASSWTLPSFSATLTGSYNIANVEGLRAGAASGRPWGTVPRTWAEVMNDNGYDTYAVLSNPHLDAVRILSKGFSHFGYVGFHPALATVRFYHTAIYFAVRGRRCSREVPGETTRRLVDRTLKVLRTPGRRPKFVWVHILDPHYPYQPLKEVLEDGAPYLLNRKAYGTDRRYLNKANYGIVKALYDQEVRSTDLLLAPLMAELERRRDTIVIISADHGEEFFEHGGREHGHTLYDEVCRVPLIVALPERRGLFKGVSEEPAPVSLVDVAPSVLNYLGLAVPPTMEGRQDLFEATSQEKREVFMTLNLAENLLAAVVGGDKKVIAKIKGREAEIKYFDLAADPKEQNPLAPDDDGERLKNRLLEWVRQRDVSGAFGEGDASLFGDREDLRALGYM